MLLASNTESMPSRICSSEAASSSTVHLAKSFVFLKLLPLFGVDVSSGDLLFSQGHGLASGEKAELLVQFGQADASGFVRVVF